MDTPLEPSRSRIVFDAAIGIGIGAQISDIPVHDGMNETAKSPARSEVALRDRFLSLTSSSTLSLMVRSSAINSWYCST